MIYVFEDDERDPLPQLFMKAYNRQISSTFIYTRGNGNIYNNVVNLVSSGEDIVVYLDTIPGNDSTRRLYVNLRRLSRQNSNRIIVLPIIGLEYYFIKSIQYENVITSSIDIKICVNRKAYFESQLLSEPKEKKYCKYYERYCKIILSKAVLDCIKNTEDDGNNLYFRWYYERSCRCESSLSSCNEKELSKKATDFIRAFPYVPGGSIVLDTEEVSKNDIWMIHRNLVDEHNELCRELRQKDPDISRKNLYKEIKYINDPDTCYLK